VAKPQRFHVQVPLAVLDDLQWRLRHARLPPVSRSSGSADGLDPALLSSLVEHWMREFDWTSRQSEINRLRQFTHNLHDVRIHFVHQRGHGPAPLPLVLTHGWPGSFLEMERILPLLTDPAAFGADRADAFDVIVPSIPGFGFSELPPDRGMHAFEIADLWSELMSALGYARFGVQGGDFGASINTALGLRHRSRLVGIHLNYIPGSLTPYRGPESPPLTPAELAFIDDTARWYERNGGYAHVQRTRPRTLAYALDDSPVGLAAWIVEKFVEWSDCGGEVETRFTYDQLLSNVMIYWVTRTAYSAARLYWEMRARPLTLGTGDFVDVPCGIARLPRESPFPPREWIERAYRVVRWSDLPSGGHFAAMEEPERLAADIREFFRPLRDA
jgi:pimeloyl-ACP methyl ester carboxylesterase